MTKLAPATRSVAKNNSAPWKEELGREMRGRLKEGENKGP